MNAPTSAIESVLVENRVSPLRGEFIKLPASRAWPVTKPCAQRLKKTTKASGPAWRAKTWSWSKPFTQVLDESNAPFYKWFADGELNASANCLDKHMGTPTENKTAIIFEADDGASHQGHLPRAAGPGEPVCQWL